MKTILRASLLSAVMVAVVFSTAPTQANAAGDKALAVSQVSASERARVVELVQKKTGMKATNVETSPLPNFYTVTVDLSVYYMDKGGKWLLDGHMVDLDTKTSITAVKKQALEAAGTPKLDWRSLNLADAIKTVRGSAVPGRVLVTFEDPNCGYCKKLHPELDKLDNLTVYTFPVAFLGADSQFKNEAIWCSKSRPSAWAAAMAGLPVKAEVACDVTGLQRNIDLARAMMVRGTPTMFLADGSRAVGYMEAAALEAKLVAQQQK